MTLNDRHIKITSFTPSPAHTALKKAVKVAGIALGLIVGVLLGGAETDLPRCGVDNLNPHGSRDNLLDNDTIKHLRLWQRKDIQRLGNSKQILRG